MKAKTIREILKKVHHNFVESIRDESVKRMVKANSIITGGCIVSMLQGEKVNDYDYYFTDKQTCIKVAEYYVNRFKANTGRGAGLQVTDDAGRVRVFIKSSGIAIDSKLKDTDDKGLFEPVCITANAISLTNDIQLVIRFYGDADKIRENYDFIHATSYWASNTGGLFLPAKALESILTKELIYSGSKYPLCSILRTKKFINRGWTISAGQYLKMALQLNELDLHNIDVLEEQLTGVDSAYFQILIEALRKKKNTALDFGIDNNYVFELINRIFE